MPNFSRIEEFASTIAVLACDAVTAQYYGSIKNKLKEKGKPIPENDIWIAAITQQYQLIIVTRDAHFNEIEDLTLQLW